MKDFGLSQRNREELLNYFKTNSNVKKVCIFGSRAKGTYKNASDIDFALWLDDDTKTLDIEADLDDLATPYKFDVINYNTLSHQGMKESIDRDGILFYQR